MQHTADRTMSEDCSDRAVYSTRTSDNRSIIDLRLQSLYRLIYEELGLRGLTPLETHHLRLPDWYVRRANQSRRKLGLSRTVIVSVLLVLQRYRPCLLRR